MPISLASVGATPRQACLRHSPLVHCSIWLLGSWTGQPFHWDRNHPRLLEMSPVSPGSSQGQCCRDGVSHLHTWWLQQALGGRTTLFGAEVCISAACSNPQGGTGVRSPAPDLCRESLGSQPGLSVGLRHARKSQGRRSLASSRPLYFKGAGRRSVMKLRGEGAGSRHLPPPRGPHFLSVECQPRPWLQFGS